MSNAATKKTPDFTPYANPDLPLNAPDFGKINEENYVEHVKEAIEIARKRVAAIKGQNETPTYDNTIMALHHADRELEQVTSIFYTLFNAESTDAMQPMAQEIGPMMSEFSNDIGLDPVIFSRIDDLWSRRDTLGLTNDEMMVLEKSWIGFARNGAKLNDEDKEKLRKIDAEMSKLSPKFSDNARLSANAFEMIITDEADLAGLPDNAKTASRELAESKGHADAWMFNLDYPSYIPFITYADNRELREKMWRAFSSRGFGGDYDNQDTIKQIVSLRIQRAQLLGYDTHADYVLERRMAEKYDTVDAFLTKLETNARPAAEREFKMIKDFAAKQGFEGDLKPWDLSYWSEKLKQAEYDFDEDKLRPYFPLQAVIDGVFKHAEMLFGVKCTAVQGLPVYHPDVTTFEVRDLDGTMRGLLYADFHPRTGKRQGAWQGSIRDRDMDENGNVELPLINIVMNFTKPTKDTPALLNFDEVETLFHEFGHALHSLLTDINHGAISGTSVYWDFVELPSQMMENWLGEPETLNMFARHYETNKPIPEDMIQKLKSSRNFMKGWFLMRQVMLCRLDLAWHILDSADDLDDVLPFEREVVEQYSFLPYEGGCTSCSFSHIFAGGYSAGYYSYLWAQVLDADAFEAFQEKGLYDAETGGKFRSEILAKGGSRPPLELYRNFRGRDADPDALLRRDGLI
jgi:peptidyl-dipeptidase Dcp